MTNAAEHSARWILGAIGLAPKGAEELACVAGVLLRPDGQMAGFGVFTSPRRDDLDATTRRLFGTRELGRLGCHETREALVDAFRRKIIPSDCPVLGSAAHELARAKDGSVLETVLITNNDDATAATGHLLEAVRGPGGPRPALSLMRLADETAEEEVRLASEHLAEIDDAPLLQRAALSLAAYYRYLVRAQPKPELTAADVAMRVAEWQRRLNAFNDFMRRPR